MGILRRVAARVVGRVRDRQPSQAAPRSAGPAPATPAPSAAVDGGAVLAAETLQTLGCDPQELRERLDAGESVVIVDLRAGTQGGIPGARHIPSAELATRWSELADADEIVLYDDSGATSEDAARLLRDRGLINATSLDGGLAAWRALGGRVVD